MAEMKKSLFTLAALSTFSGALSAQSNLTIYGVIDIAYLNEKSRSNINSQANASAIINSPEQLSRLGFRGTEDFGGGMRAFFVAESVISAANASLSDWRTMQAFTGLGRTDIGQFAFGTQNTPIFNQLLATDVGMANNMPGSAVFPVSSVYSSGLPSKNTYYSGNEGGVNVSDALTIRTQSALSVQSTTLADFKVAGFYTLRNDTIKGNSKNQPVPISNNYSGWGLSADYTWQKLYIGIAYQALKSANLGYGCEEPGECASTAYTPQAKGWAVTSGGVNTQDNQYYGGITYSFDKFKMYLQYVNRKATNILDTQNYSSRSAQQIGVRSFLTTAIEGWANIGYGKNTSYDKSYSSATFTAWQLGLNYYLSKRTNLYTIYGAETEYTAAKALAAGLRVVF